MTAELSSPSRPAAAPAPDQVPAPGPGPAAVAVPMTAEPVRPPAGRSGLAARTEPILLAGLALAGVLDCALRLAGPAGWLAVLTVAGLGLMAALDGPDRPVSMALRALVLLGLAGLLARPGEAGAELAVAWILAAAAIYPLLLPARTAVPVSSAAALALCLPVALRLLSPDRLSAQDFGFMAGSVAGTVIVAGLGAAGALLRDGRGRALVLAGTGGTSGTGGGIGGTGRAGGGSGPGRRPRPAPGGRAQLPAPRPPRLSAPDPLSALPGRADLLARIDLALSRADVLGGPAALFLVELEPATVGPGLPVPAGPHGHEGPNGPAGPHGHEGPNGPAAPHGHAGPHGNAGPHGQEGPHVQGPHGPDDPDGADEVLHQVARRLRAALPAEDVVARLAGRSFGLLAGGIDPASCPALARRLTALVEEPLPGGSGRATGGCNIGVAVAGPGTGIGTAEQLLAAATEALRAAQRGGPTRWVLHDPALRAHAHCQPELEAELRQAIRDRTVELAYQPILTLDPEGSDRIVGAEALACWVRADGVPVPPHRFVPLADRLGLGAELGELLLERALATLSGWRAGGGPIRALAVNVSPAQLDDPGFAAGLAARLAAHRLQPADLTVEIPADEFVDTEQARSTLGQLRSLGVGLCLDHFGRSGLSLAALGQLPLTGLKLDRSLAAGLGGDSRLLRSALSLGGSFGLRCTVLGVESQDQLDAARALGADAVQGFLIAPPAPPGELGTAGRKHGE